MDTLKEFIPFVSDFLKEYSSDFSKGGYDEIFVAAFIVLLVVVVFLTLRKG